jgi:sulfonate transport system substrate-binding protein
MPSQPLRIGGVPEHFNYPFHLLADSQNGPPFHWQDFPGGTGALCKVLAANELDVALVLSEGVVAFTARGGEAVVPGFWVQSPLIWGIHTGALSSYQSVADLAGQAFAISRPGSGSQLMVYLLAQQQGWPRASVRFVEVGNLAGATQALTHQEAAGFLWERFMTQPLVDSGTFRRLGTLPTPWPAFAVAVRPDVWVTRQGEVRQLMEAALGQAKQLATSPTAARLIAAHYSLAEVQVAEWLNLTQWAYPWSEGIDDALAEVANTLAAIGAL